MKRYLDKLTGRVTMYRLVIYALATMAGISLVLSFVGILQFNPLSMVIGLGLLMGTSLGVNYLFAYIFSVRAHNESAVISAFILFFILSPPITSSSFIVMVLVAAIAAASKYLLVWKGRHIFNPAAIAAVISGIVGLQYASWWVATGSLTLVTGILGLVVLYKTRRLKTGITYVGISIVTIIFVTAISGSSVIEQLPLLFTSWPLLFFAGFMLSEPLTLPPRRYQRYALASGVAVLANTPLIIFGISSSPEIALIIGNVFAFLCGQRGGIRLTFASRRPLAKDHVEYTFIANRKLHFKPGQYIELQIPHRKPDTRGVRRMFTIVSQPGESELRIATRHYHPSSTYKKALLHMPVGARVSATGIYGDFVLPDDPNKKLLFIAGGIGITPFYSYIQSLIASGGVRDSVLIYGVRDTKDVVYNEVIHAEHQGITSHIATDYISDELLKKYAHDIGERHVYISGPPGMVDSTVEIVKRHSAQSIIKDYFSGY